MKTIKRTAAFILAISFCFVLMLSPGANAQGAISGQQFGAWIASALVSLNCIGQIIGGDFQSGIDAFHQIQHNLGVTTIQETIDSLPTPYDVYTFNDAAVSEALNTSIIKIRKGVTTIDGVQYDELWVSPEGAQKLKTNAFDFITKYNLIANDTSTLATGVGMLDGAPMYSVNNVIRSQSLTPPGYLGNSRVYAYPSNNPGEYAALSVQMSDGVAYGMTSKSWAPYTDAHFEVGNRIYLWGIDSRDVSKYAGPIDSRYYSAEPFQFDFVSGVIPSSEDIPNDYGLSVQIPHEQLENFYTVYPQYNVDNSVINIQQDQIDINDLTNAIFDYVESMQDIKAEWTNGEGPAPVDPIENIDQNVEDISQYQADMQQQVEHMHQDVEAIHQTQQQMQQNQQQIQQDTSSIDSTLKDATATPGQSDLPSFKFDLRELFPFCIPFDIYRLLSSFDATPTAPHVQLPIVIQSIGFNYTLDLDFTIFDPVAQILRTAELIVYALGLAWATGKVIKW